MRKFLLSISALLLSVVVSAQDGFAVLGGITTSSARLEEVDFENVARWHFGAAYKQSILFGFAVQPELCYNVKGSSAAALVGNAPGQIDLKMGYAEFGTQLQWGPDLVLFRPYVFFEPFLGYAVNNRIARSGDADKFRAFVDNSWECIKRLEYGYSMGGGLELFGTLQLSAKYFRNLGTLLDDVPGTTPEAVCLKSSIRDGENFGGWVFSLGIFF